MLTGWQPLVRLVVHGRVVAVLRLVSNVAAADAADAADVDAADATDATDATAAQHRAAPAVQRRRPNSGLGLGPVQVFHVDRLLFGRPERGLLELQQRHLLSAAL